MDTILLETFALVARHGSFAAAARAASLDPSVISRSISTLESTIGCRLLQRTTRQMDLTEAGTLYLSRIEPIIGELARARDEARSITSAPSGRVKLTASVAFGLACLVPLLADFHRAFPEIKLELQLSDDNLDLTANRIDLAIRLAPQIDKDVICSKFFDTHYRVCAGHDYLAKHGRPETPEQIGGHKALLFALPGYRSHWLFRDNQGALSTVAVHGAFEISNALALRAAMLAGLGPALLADWLIGDDLRQNRCVDLFPDHDVTATSFDTAAWLIYPNRSFLPAKARATIDLLRQKLEKRRFT